MIKICLFVCFALQLVRLEAASVSLNEAEPNVPSLGSTKVPPVTPTITPPSTSNVPSALALLNKMPQGTQNILFSLLMGDGSLDMDTLTQLMISLTPSLLGGMTGNISGMTESERICHEDMETFMNDTLTSKPWAINMMDAMGKPGPGLMKGTTKFYGNFHQCLESVSEVSRVTSRTVRGDYCVASIKPPEQLMSFQADVPETFAGTINFDWHICVPDTCGSQAIWNGLQGGLSQLNVSIAYVACHSEVKNGPVGQDGAAVGAIILISILGFLVFLGTILDLYIRVIEGRKDKAAATPQGETYAKMHNERVTDNGHALTVKDIKDNVPADICRSNGHVETDDKDNPVRLQSLKQNGAGPLYLNGGPVVSNTEIKLSDKKAAKDPLWQRLLLCFSAVANGEKILSVKNTPGSLTCLNGIRVLSMGWVILGHTYSFLTGLAANPSTALEMSQTFLFQVVINGTLSVDSFFLLSGLLVTYLFLKETEKVGGVKIKQMVMYYVHRYWRLTPAYAFMIFFSTCLSGYLVDGPLWQGPFDKAFCQENWWLNMLYVNNLVNVKAQCFGVGWYLANDMQFYVFAPLALIPLALGKQRGYGRFMKIFGLCVVAGFVITSIVTTAYFVHDTNGNIFNNTDDYMYKVYFKPWCRIGTFAIGVVVGYILHTTKARIQLSTFVQGLGWFLALSATLAITFSTYDENGPGRSPWGVAARTAHETLFRPVWGLVLGWVIVMCCSGKAGIIDWLLSWSWWQPLARLTYGAFLTHPIIMMCFDMGSVTRLINYTTFNMVNRFFGYTCLSYITAFLLAILVEAPLLQLEKMVLSK